MKQTAVDWLENELKKIPFVKVNDVFKKAKQMEKEQIDMAYKEGAFCNEYKGYTEQYYKETYE